MLEETTFNKANPDLSTDTPDSLTTYTIGDDVIAQKVDSAAPQYLLYDGHGSTRQLAGYASGTGVTIAESYSYDGYGVLLQDKTNFTPNSGPYEPGYTPPQATNLLYSGEMFDTDAQQYYLRARYYNPLNGLFNQTDPYAGNLHDPQSLHKYAYCHNNPVSNIDPLGMFSLTEINISQAIQSSLRQIQNSPAMTVYRIADRTIDFIQMLDQFRQLLTSIPQIVDHLMSLKLSLANVVAGPNIKLLHMTASHVEEVATYLLRELPSIVSTLVKEHGRRIGEAVASLKKPNGKRDRIILYLPSLMTPINTKDMIMNVSGHIGEFPLALGIARTGGGRLFGVGFTDGNKGSQYQVFRIDWHGQWSGAHKSPYAGYFRVGPIIPPDLTRKPLFHYHIPTKEEAM